MRKAVIIVIVWALALTSVANAVNPNPVSWLDLAAFIDQWLAKGVSANGWCDGADINHSGEVDFADFSLFAQYWLRQTPAYYVAPYGDDSNPGTLIRPFRTIQKAADVMTAGDTCYIREGRYHEGVVINNLDGTQSKPIAFRSYPGEKAILDGTVNVAMIGGTVWTQHSGSIYKTTLTEDIWQLFVDGEWMVPARWPNANFDDGSIWNHQRYWGHINAAASANGVLVDLPHDGIGLAASGLDMTGALLIEEGRERVKVITGHSAGSSTIYHEPFSNYDDDRYYVECKLDLLDAEKEWYYDKNTNALYLWAPGGTPTGDIRAKVQDYAFEIAESDYIVINGLGFFGTTVKFYKSKYALIENCRFLYPSCSKRMLGNTGDRAVTQIKEGHKTDPSYGSIINCTFENTDSEAIYCVGSYNTIENCYFRNIDFSSSPLDHGQYSVYTKGSYNTFRRNTMDNCAAGDFLYPGEIPTIEYNNPRSTCLNEGDSAIFHLMIGSQPNSRIAYNWVYNAPVKGVRFDAPMPPTRWGDNGLMHHNVIFDLGMSGLMIKGEDHKCYSNTGFIGSENDIVILDDSADGGGGNVGTITRNNAAEKLSGTRGGYYPLPGTHDHNWNGYVTGVGLRTQLRDPDNFDFRPKADSSLIDAGAVVAGITDGYLGAAPDIGAYEYGDANYWIPGCKFEKASTPIPPDNATDAKPDAELMWLGGYRADSHDVYFGTDANAVADADANSSQYEGTQTTNIFAPGPLDTNITYYWRIDARSNSGTVKGDVWSFSVSRPTATLELAPTDDTYVDKYEPDTNMNGQPKLRIRGYPENRLRYAYLKFDSKGLITGDILSANLHIRASLGYDIDDVQFYAVTYGPGGEWFETTLTWNSDDLVWGGMLDSWDPADGSITDRTWYDFDVTGLVIEDDGKITIGIKTTSNYANHGWLMRESNQPPVLTIVYDSN